MTACSICKHESQFYFSKRFEDFDLGKVEYYKCPNCGFVFSRTHREMPEARWNKLNLTYHRSIESLNVRSLTNQPPYLQQALLLNTLLVNGVVALDDCLDWGSGYGTLSKVLMKYFGIRIANYDKHMRPQHNFLSGSRLAGKKFRTVISSAVFEHVGLRQVLDEINSYVSEKGCFIVHTVVCDKIPQDPGWFYLLPVHCAFYTNKSMKILMKQWGYVYSIYCPAAKTWVMYKSKPKKIDEIVNSINTELQTKYLYSKPGFVDYWK